MYIYDHFFEEDFEALFISLKLQNSISDSEGYIGISVTVKGLLHKLSNVHDAVGEI